MSCVLAYHVMLCLYGNTVKHFCISKSESIMAGINASSPLHLAAESGDVNKVRKLLQSGEYNVNRTDSNGKTPLHYACAKDHLDMVKVLISDFNSNVLFKDIND